MITKTEYYDTDVDIYSLQNFWFEKLPSSTNPFFGNATAFDKVAIHIKFIEQRPIYHCNIMGRD